MLALQYHKDIVRATLSAPSASHPAFFYSNVNPAVELVIFLFSEFSFIFIFIFYHRHLFVAPLVTTSGLCTVCAGIFFH